jgi:hypothetical protein
MLTSGNFLFSRESSELNGNPDGLLRVTNAAQSVERVVCRKNKKGVTITRNAFNAPC